MLLTKILDDRSHSSDACRVEVTTWHSPTQSHAFTLDLAREPELLGTLYQTLGRTYLDAGRYRDAANAFEQAVKLRQSIYGNEHPLVAESQNRLASTLRRLGELDEARQLIDLARGTNVKFFGGESVPVALDDAEIAAILLQEGKVDQVRTVAQQSANVLAAKKDARRTIPMDLVARALQMCAKTQPDALEQAAKLYTDIIAIDLAQPAKELHPEYATHLHNQGTVVQSLNDPDGAIKKYRRAIELWTALHGEVHPDVVDAYSNIGRAYRQKVTPQTPQFIDEAELHFEKALELDQKLRGADHPYVAYDLTGIATLVLLRPERSQEQLEEASEHLKLAEAILSTERNRPIYAEHGFLAHTLETHAKVLTQLGDIKTAEQKQAQAAAIRQAIANRCSDCTSAK